VSERHTWIPVAFVRQTSGRLHVLFSLDRDGSPAYEGEPVLLVDHRPEAGIEDIEIEGSDVVAAADLAGASANLEAFATCFTRAFAADGSFVADQLLAERIHLDVDA
jgi:hypothetical protein